MLLFLFVGATSSFAQPPLVRYPSLSPDAQQVAFSFQGDLWVMDLPEGTPRRLTVHEAYESHPRWSRDGKHIAFSSDRYSHNDIFVIPAEGGISKRLTYHSTNDNVGGWTPDKRILFETARAYRAVEWDREIHSVSTEGETPVRAMNAMGYMPAASPSGRFVAFVRGACRVSREDYDGPANKDIWLFDTQDEKYVQLTKDTHQDVYPVWGKDDQTLFFLSARNGRYNVHRLGLSEAGDPQQGPEAMTNFTDYGARYLEGSTDGSTLVLERFDRIYTLPTEGGEPQAIEINLATDYRFDPQEHKTYTGNARSYDISPSGERVVVEIHGEVFVKKNDKDKKRTVNRSKHPYRDTDPIWINDSTVLFASDRDGNYELYLSRSTDEDETDLFETLKYETVQITSTKAHESNPVLSPDGKKLAFTRDRGTLVVADISAEGELSNETVLLDTWTLPSGISWSPDSRWLAYSLPNLDFNHEVYIHAADNSREPVNVSMHPRRDMQPNWSRDGSKLTFVSSRNNGDYDVWFVWLKKEDWQKTKRDWEESDDEDKKEEKKDEDSEEVAPIEIDFPDIHYRMEQVTSMPGDEYSPVFSEDGEMLFFTAESNTDDSRELYKVKWDGSEAKMLTGGSPGGLSLSPDGKDIYFVKRGKLGKVSASGGSAEMFAHVAKMTIDFAHEQEQIFEEAWNTIQQGFYDPEFHGYDWKDLKARYKDLALRASTKRDFRDMFNEMLGQLNASHMGMYGGADPAETQRERTGYLGIEAKPTKNGMEITYIVPETPADRTMSKLQVGEVIMSINGIELDENSNLYRYLINTAEDEMLLTVRGTDKKLREVVIRPARSIENEKYDAWVEERRELTERYSDGKLGYIHIEGMNWPSFERFERELAASGMGKEGLVIDVRYNGGGWTTDYLMTVLSVRQHAYTIPRGAAASLDEHEKFRNNYPYGERLPLSSWTKPSIALCNPNSYSNAEIFSHAFKTLDIGKLVGKPTFGAVISTGGRRMIDGALVRLPFRAWYVKETGENMELGPAVPDIIVENAPDNRAQGEDAQLRRAVEELLKK